MNFNADRTNNVALQEREKKRKWHTIDVKRKQLIKYAMNLKEHKIDEFTI